MSRKILLPTTIHQPHQGVSNVEQSVRDSDPSIKTTTTFTKIYSCNFDHHANTVDNAVLCRAGLIEDICGVPEIRPKRALDGNRFESLFDLVSFIKEAEEDVEPIVTLDEEPGITQLPEDEVEPIVTLKITKLCIHWQKKVTAPELNEDVPAESNVTGNIPRSGVFYRFPCPDNDNYGYFVNEESQPFAAKVDTRMVPGSYVPDHIPIIRLPGGYFSLPPQEILYSSTDPSDISKEALSRRRVTFNNFTQERKAKDGVNENRLGTIVGPCYDFCDDRSK